MELINVDNEQHLHAKCFKSGSIENDEDKTRTRNNLSSRQYSEPEEIVKIHNNVKQNVKLNASNGCNAAKNDSTPNSDELPEFLQTLLEGSEICGDSRCSFAKPDWFDVQKFRLGQEFGVKYMFGIMHADLLSLFILFSFEGGLGPLIYTGQSDTPFKAYKRYLSTSLRVKSWYDTDIWQEDSVGHKNLKIVRSMHEVTRKRMSTTPPEEVARKVTLEKDEDRNPMWTTLYDEIQEDFQSCPALRVPLRGSKPVHISQTDMTVTQFGFVGLILLFPKMFGIHNASTMDWEGFIHFWRTIGYLLGIEDRFNLCNGNVNDVQQRCRDIIGFWVRPSFKRISRDWIHMSRCLVKGLSYYIHAASMEVFLVYLCTILNIATPRLFAALGFWQKSLYYYTLFLYLYILRMPGMLVFHNWLFNLALKHALKIEPRLKEEKS